MRHFFDRGAGFVSRQLHSECVHFEQQTGDEKDDEEFVGGRARETAGHVNRARRADVNGDRWT